MVKFLLIVLLVTSLHGMEDEESYAMYKAFRGIHAYIYRQYVSSLDEGYKKRIKIIVSGEVPDKSLIVVQYNDLPFYMMTPAGISYFSLSRSVEHDPKKLQAILDRFNAVETFFGRESSVLTKFVLRTDLQGNELPLPTKIRRNFFVHEQWGKFAEQYEKECEEGEKRSSKS